MTIKAHAIITVLFLMGMGIGLTAGIDGRREESSIVHRPYTINNSSFCPPSASGSSFPVPAAGFCLEEKTDIQGSATFSAYTRRYPGEIETVRVAAERNGCRGDDFVILLAIRFAENGRPGREFGVDHPKAIYTDLDTQAGWCAATIVKNRQRHGQLTNDDGRSFLDFLAERYCPLNAAVWKKNVQYWVERLTIVEISDCKFQISNLTTDGK